MALRFVDGFDHYSVNQMLKKWTNYSSAQPPTISTTGARNGSALTFSISSAANISKSLDNQATWIVGFACKFPTLPTTSNRGFLTFTDSGTTQINIGFNGFGDNKLFVKRGSVTSGTLLGTTTLGIPTNVWFFIEAKVTVNNTTGIVVIKINGNTVLNLSGQNTRSTANNYANQILFANDVNAGNGTGVAWLIDDLYICDGNSSGTPPNNDFLGDCKVEALYPSANGTNTDWTGVNNAIWGQLQSNTTSAIIGLSTNVLVYTKCTALYNGTVTQVQGIISSNITGKVNCAIYSDSSNAPNILLAQATELTNPTTGTITFTLTSSISVTKGTTYWIALWANVSTSAFNAMTSVITTCTQALTYSATFPSSAGAGAAGSANNGAYLVANATGLSKFDMVGETTLDEEFSYVRSSTLNQIDTYNLGNLASTPVSIFGTQVNLLARKDATGNRALAPVLRSGGTNYVGADQYIGGDYYDYLQINEVDPATSAAWTQSGINALEAGIKLTV